MVSSADALRGLPNEQVAVMGDQTPLEPLVEQALPCKHVCYRTGKTAAGLVPAKGLLVSAIQRQRGFHQVLANSLFPIRLGQHWFDAAPSFNSKLFARRLFDSNCVGTLASCGFI